MIENIYVNKKLLALIIRRGYSKGGVNFFTQKQSTLQLGIAVYTKGTTVNPHVHKKIYRSFRESQEILYVAKGVAKVDIYFNKEKVATRILKQQDTILFLSGGHGIKFLKNTKLIEIKQGPYLDKRTDKRYVRPE